ncbi:cell adhesion molecule-like protein, partial [Leptotrombidium deliense]
MTSLTKEDSGVYKCMASNLNGDRSEGRIWMRVVASPVLSPFLFPSNLEEGMRTSVICSVISGDPPIHIKWFKDGHSLHTFDAPQTQRYQIAALNEFVSSLTIASVDRLYSGNFTCKASNTVAEMNYTAPLQVRSQPVWLLKPNSQSVISGMSVRFDCQADAYPQPVIRWKLIRFNANDAIIGSSGFFGFRDTLSSLASTVAPISILSSPRIHVLENGSLVIKSVQSLDQGTYFCEASNGIGKTIESSADLLVFEAPRVKALINSTVIRKGERTDIACQVVGSQPISIVWTRNENGEYRFASTDHYTVREDIKDGVKLSLLSIEFSTRKDSAVFSCVATNFYGRAKSTVSVIVEEPPDAPFDFRVLEIGSKKVIFSWTNGYNGNSQIIGYEVQYKLKTGTFECFDLSELKSWFEARKHFVTELSLGSNSLQIDGLRSMQQYKFRIRAKNEIGESVFSDEIELTTKMEAPTLTPQNVTCVAIGAKTMKISWVISNTADIQFVEGFSIGYKKIESHGSYVYNTMHTVLKITMDNGQQRFADHLQRRFEYTIEKLEKATKYSVVVQAFNSVGTGPYSEEVNAVTFSSDPPKAPLLKVESVTTKSAFIIWAINEEDESSIHGFHLNYRVDIEKHEKGLSDDSWESVRLPNYQRKHKLTNLKCGTRYVIAIKAFNEVGNGEESSEFKFITNGRAPIAPEKQAFIRSNITFVILMLNAWNDGNCAISHFQVRYKPRQQPDWITHSTYILPAQQNVVIRDLSPGTWHDLSVLVSNDAGETEASYLFATLTTTGATVAP